MDTYKIYEHPTHEPDEQEREKMMFNNPFQASVIEGASEFSPEADLNTVVILSSN